MPTAFIASTLPALFLKKNLEVLKINKIVVSRKDLLNSFSFLLTEHQTLDIIVSPDKNTKSFLRKQILSSSDGVVIFHECGWFDLDLLLLEIKPRLEFYPQVTLETFKKFEKEDLRIFSLILNCTKSLSISSLKLLFRALKYKDKFIYYSLPQDNNTRLGFEYSLNHEKYLKFTNSIVQSIPSEELAQARKVENISKNIIVFTGTDIFATTQIEDIYNKVFRLIQKKGYQVIIKDHPNPAFRLNMSFKDSIQLEASLPFEILEIDYFLKIGIASTSLAYEAGKSISIIHLLGNDSEIENRIKHLNSLPEGNKIKYPKSISALEDLL